MMNFKRDVLIAKLGHLQDAIERIDAKRPETLEMWASATSRYTTTYGSTGPS